MASITKHILIANIIFIVSESIFCIFFCDRLKNDIGLAGTLILTLILSIIASIPITISFLMYKIDKLFLKTYIIYIYYFLISTSSTMLSNFGYLDYIGITIFEIISVHFILAIMMIKYKYINKKEINIHISGYFIYYLAILLILIIIYYFFYIF